MWTVVLMDTGALFVAAGIADATGHGPKAAAAAPTVTVTATQSVTASATATVKASAAAVRATVTPTARPSLSPSAAAPPDCLSQVRAWISGGSSKQLGALQADFSAFSAAGQTFVAHQEAGGATPADVSAVQNAAAAIQADAQAMESDPASSCGPGMRPALDAAATDYQKAAIDADTR